MTAARNSPFKALQHRNFRLIWIGQLVSMAGSMMQSAAILWHVSVLVDPAQRGLALGFVGLVRVVPIVVFSLVAGVVADAHDRRRLMLFTQTGMLISAALLAWAAFAGVRAVWPIYALAATGAAFGTFDNPARQALIPTLVPAADLPNAISLNAIMFQTASVVGPAAGGVLIGELGIGWAYAFNAASFLCVIAAVLLMRGVPGNAEGSAGRISLAAAIEGLRFVFKTPLIRSTMLLDFFATFFASATALLPIFAQDILHVGARGYGVLSAAPSAGAIIASLVMVRAVDHIERRGPVLLWAIAFYGLATAVFGFSRLFALSFLCLAITGAADTVSMVIRNLVRQLATPDHIRGRMTSVNMIFFMGGPQLGELEAGLVASAWGPVLSVVSGGLGCLFVTAAVAARAPQLREYRASVHLVPSDELREGAL
ncbi:MAG TPA: MFS transporter [Vicinamibacterales bacterium]|nr:MFS transporter [Vicinamibacterales bacterium]